MSDRERYENIDLPFYHDRVAPVLPERVLDFHTHTWKSEHWNKVPWKTDVNGAKYMVTLEQYGVESLRADGRALFPDRPCDAVCFGWPSPAADLAKTNGYSAEAGRHSGLFPLFITGRGTLKPDELRAAVCDQGFFGYKVLISWHGNEYGQVTVEEMISREEMALADELSLVVLLHVPRAGRLTDPVVQRGVRTYAEDFPGASIVLAHCGRCYHPDEMRSAIGSVADLRNVYFDTSMVMDPLVLQMVFDRVDSSRVVFGTDLPVAAMRGRRVYVMDHWVDVVLEGHPPSAYRVASNDIRATFMAWEIVLAVHRGAVMAGLTQAQTKNIFRNNGLRLLQRVMDGRQLGAVENRCAQRAQENTSRGECP